MAWPQNAYVGQKVVCIDEWKLNGKGRGDEQGPIEGEVYTIQEIGLNLFDNGRTSGEIQVRLLEIKNPRLYYMIAGLREVAFRISRFRPVQSTETGMDILRSVLNTQKVTENV